MKRNNNYLWILVCSVLVIFCLVLWHSNHELKQDSQAQNSQIEKLQKKNAELKREEIISIKKEIRMNLRKLTKLFNTYLIT